LDRLSNSSYSTCAHTQRERERERVLISLFLLKHQGAVTGNSSIQYAAGHAFAEERAE